MSVTQGTIQLGQEIPFDFAMGSKNFTSTSDYVLRRTHQQIPPLNDIEFSPTKNEIIIDFASNVSFIDLMNMYVSGKLSFSGMAAGDAYMLEKNGIHALIESVELRIASTQVTIERLDKYNSFTAMEDALVFSDAELSSNFHDELKNDGSICQRSGGVLDFGLNTSIVGGSDGDGFYIDFTAGNAYDMGLTCGDLIHIGGATFIVRFTESTIRVRVLGNTSLITLSTYTIAYTRQGGKNSGLINGTTYQFTFKPRLGFLRQKQFFPLFLLARGLQLVIRLDPNWAFKSLIKHNPFIGGADSAISYTISNVRLNAMFYDANSIVVDRYVKLYSTGRGVVIPFKAYMDSQNLIGNGNNTEVVNFFPGVRSATHIMSRLQPSRFWSTDDKSSRRTHNLSKFPYLQLKSFQYKAGSIDFPVRKVEVDMNYGSNGDFVKHQQITYKKKKDRNMTSYVYEEEPFHGMSQQAFIGVTNTTGTSPHPWLRVESKVVVNTQLAPGYVEGSNGIMTAVLNRDCNGYFAGTDLSVTPIQIEMNFGGQMNAGYLNTTDNENLGSQRVVQSFLAYQAYLYLSETGGAQVLY